MFAQSGTATFDEIWLANPLPEPGAVGLLAVGVGMMMGRRRGDARVARAGSSKS